jgi:hypothetical protein
LVDCSSVNTCGFRSAAQQTVAHPFGGTAIYCSLSCRWKPQSRMTLRQKALRIPKIHECRRGRKKPNRKFSSPGQSNSSPCLLIHIIALNPSHHDHRGQYYQEIPVAKRSLRPSWIRERVVSPRSFSNTGGSDAFPLGQVRRNGSDSPRPAILLAHGY